MALKLKIDEKYYAFDELPKEQQEKYRADFERAERIQAIWHKELDAKNQKPTLGNKLFSYLFLICIFSICGLAFLSFFSSVNTTVKLGVVWLTLWVGITLGLIGLVAAPYIKGYDVMQLPGGIFKNALTILLGLFGFSVLCGFATLSGLPTLLHHMTAYEGDMVVTVVAKEDHYDKRECRPRLIIKEFTWFGSDYLCPGEGVYQQIEVGSRVLLTGKVSRFGIEPESLQWGGNIQ